MHKLVNGTRVPLSTQEIADRSASESEWSSGASARALSDLRAERNRLLNESDWTQATDSPLTEQKKYEWATYRQKLRDLPGKQPLVWPTKPGAGN